MRWENSLYLIFINLLFVNYGVNKSIASVFSCVNNGNVVDLVIEENEELMSKQIHLHNCFFNAHREKLKLLCSYDKFGIFVKTIVKIRKGEFALFKSFFKTSFVLSNLAVDDFYTAVHSVLEAGIVNLSAKDCVSAVNRDLNAVTFTLTTECYCCGGL